MLNYVVRIMGTTLVLVFLLSTLAPAAENRIVVEKMDASRT